MNLLESVFTVVVDTSWRASWLILAVLLLQAVGRRRVNPRVLNWLSLAVILRLLVPFAISSGWSPFPAHVFTTSAAHAGATQPAGPVPQIVAPPVAAGPLAPPPPVDRPSITPLQAMAVLWASVAVMLIATRLFAAVAFTLRVRRSSRSAPAPVLAEVRRQFGSARVRVLGTDAVFTPALHGLQQPRLLFPPNLLDELSDRELRLIIAHERGHFIRRDLLAQELARFAAAIHWFNPLAWIATQRLRRDCELACDEFVLRQLRGGDHAAYGETLLRVLRLTHAPRAARFALGIVESKQQLRQRIEMIAHPSPASPVRAALACTAAVACVAASLTRPAHAQTPSAAVVSPTAGTPVAIAPAEAPVDNLDQLFPNGVVAAMGEKTISVADVRREMAPILPQLRHEAKTPEEFRQRVGVLQNSVIKDLIGRELLIKEFHAPGTGDPGRRIDPGWIDKAIADRIEQQFGGDHDKFVAYLRQRGMTLADYHREVENDIIYSYMLAQERKLVPKPRANPPDHKGEVHLRVIQLPRNGQSDAALVKQADEVLARFHNGEPFAELASHVSVDARRSRGGDWGWIKESEVIPKYWASIRDLPKGQVAAPILLPEGAFLLYVDDRG